MKLDTETRLCGLIGNPVHHSLSPAVHNASFLACNLNFAYLAFRVEDVGSAIRGARALGIRGLSITIPHKLGVIEHLDEVDPVAARIGSVNTVVNHGGRMVGHTTDGLGALEALRAAAADPTGTDVVILGAGGSARAIAMSIALEAPPHTLTITARDIEKAEKLAAEVGSVAPTVATTGIALADPIAEHHLRGASIVIHTTSVGMVPDTRGCLVPQAWLGPGVTVFDIVYTPRVTELARRAERAGAKVVPGTEMFIRQAAAQFELWTGVRAPIDVMRREVDARLGE